MGMGSGLHEGRSLWHFSDVYLKPTTGASFPRTTSLNINSVKECACRIVIFFSFSFSAKVSDD